MALAAGTRLTSSRLHALTNVAAMLRSDTPQSIAGSTVVTLQMDVVVFDTDGMADLAGDSLVIQTAGIYSIKGGCRINVTDGTRVQIRFLVNGAAVGLEDGVAPSGTNGYMGAIDAQLAVGDTVQVAFYHEGALVSTGPGNEMPFLSVARIAGDVA